MLDIGDVILSRSLKKVRAAGTSLIDIRIARPEKVEDGDDYYCRFLIDGLSSEPIFGKTHGVDGIQALLLALKTIGVHLYTSIDAGNGELIWLEKGGGFGFPLPANLSDLYVGDDPP